MSNIYFSKFYKIDVTVCLKIFPLSFLYYLFFLMNWHFVKYLYISQTYKIDVTVCSKKSSKSCVPGSQADKQTGISQQFCMQPRQVLGLQLLASFLNDNAILLL